MTNEEITKEVGKDLLTPLGYLQLFLLVVLIIVIPIILIWHSWALSWKVGLTTLLFIVCNGLLHKHVSKIIRNTVDQEMSKKNEQKVKSKFQIKLEEAMLKNKDKNLN